MFSRSKKKFASNVILKYDIRTEDKKKYQTENFPKKMTNNFHFKLPLN